MARVGEQAPEVDQVKYTFCYCGQVICAIAVGMNEPSYGDTALELGFENVASTQDEV